MVDWIKNNWLIGGLFSLVVAAVVGMIALTISERETLGTATALSILAAAVAVVSFLILVLKRPEKITKLRINLIWVSTLVAILTLTFGNKLIALVMNPPDEQDTNTIVIVLSSLVGVGIGGLIAVAGQLVQDTGQDPPVKPSKEDNVNNGSGDEQ